MREKQRQVLKEISDAYSAGYKHVLLEAPTGFGKSPVAVAVVRTLGTSYICTSTKDLQAQYNTDFPFIKTVKGKGNFPCLIKENYIQTDKYECTTCSKFSSKCYHTAVDYGPCMTEEAFRREGCKYRTFPKHYEILNKGTAQESVVITQVALQRYKHDYDDWPLLKNFSQTQREKLVTWRPCEYFHQLHIGLLSSHTILNYSAFLSLKAAHRLVEPRECLVFDECHSLEQEVIKYKGISVSKSRWKRYISDFKLPDYEYKLEHWIEFLQKLELKMYELTGQKSVLSQIKTVRRLRADKKPEANSKIRELEKHIQESINFLSDDLPNRLPKEILIDALNDRDRLSRGLENLLLDKENWIVNDVKREGQEVTRVELKPLEVAPYCEELFSHCSKNLMMSATVLDRNAFCNNVGLEPEKVKFIHVDSDFPVSNRPIYALNVAWLNAKTISQEATQKAIAKAIDNIMTTHKDHKGIIHTTSYQQLKFIRANLSKINNDRLVETDPELQREDVVDEHFESKKPTVLISPSLYLGLDLKDDLSRFQIITKVPFPDLNDRWIAEKMKRSEEWYRWQTALRLVQSYGRSIRSMEDFAKTYVLDSMFQTFVDKNRSMIPRWFVEAIS